MELNEIRDKIDQIDRELLVLLQERMGMALRSKKFKKETTDPDREEAIMDRVRKLNLDLMQPSFTTQLLKTIIRESKRLQDEDRKLVAFQGEHGAYGEVAARELMPNGAYIPCMEFVDVFKGVEEGYLDVGVVPVENSLEGAVTQVNDLLSTTNLTISGEANVAIHHCLMAPAGTDYREIRTVYSHPQALAQCRGFLMRNKLEPHPYYDTAGAAKMLARENPHGAAAIAGTLCAELYGLEVLKEKIEDAPANLTRFLLISREPGKVPGDKTSILFATSHEAGSLYQVLRLVAEKNINLTRIASMPLRSDPGNYSFFLDFEGDRHDPDVIEVLGKMKSITTFIKHLGSYSKAVDSVSS